MAVEDASIKCARIKKIECRNQKHTYLGLKEWYRASWSECLGDKNKSKEFYIDATREENYGRSYVVQLDFRGTSEMAVAAALGFIYHLLPSFSFSFLSKPHICKSQI